MSSRARVWLAVIAVCLAAMLWSLVSWFHSSGPDPLLITWAGDDGISVGRPGTFQQRNLALRDRQGRLILNPAYAFTPSGLAYWSPSDGAIGVVSAGRPIRWIKVHPTIPDEWSVMTLAAGGGRVLLNLYQPRYNPTEGRLPLQCRAVDLKSGLASLIPDIQQAEESSDGKSMADLNEAGRLELRSGGTRTYVSEPGDRVAGWDCDPAGGVACYLSGSDVTLVGPGRRRRDWTVWPPLVNPEYIMLEPHLHQVWVSAEWMYSLGYELMVYNYDGRLCYHAGAPDSILDRPMRPVDARMLKTLSELTAPKPGEDGVES